jgi:predicted RND superfamily exporter protein
LLVDFTNQLRREGMPLEDAIRKAGEVRFVPIVLTSLTAIGGLTPLAIEFNPLYSPLAWVLIGGLISSTLLSRIVTPVLYKILPPGVEVSGEKVVNKIDFVSGWNPQDSPHEVEPRAGDGGRDLARVGVFLLKNRFCERVEPAG